VYKAVTPELLRDAEFIAQLKEAFPAQASLFEESEAFKINGTEGGR
jgi:hypothetical protein